MNKRLISLFLIFQIISAMLAIPASAANEEWDPFNGDKDVNIAFIGGSITAGMGYRNSVSEYLKEKYEGIVQGRKMSFYNAGKGGTGSHYGLLRLDRDVISHNPDMVFIEFAVNDAGRAEEDIQGDFEGMIRLLQSLPNPPMITIVYTTLVQMSNEYEKQHKIAEYYGIPEIDFLQLMKDKGYTKPSDTSYDKLPTMWRELLLSNMHPNTKCEKLWSDYAIALMEKSPEKYFRHPILKSNPFSGKYIDGLHTKFEYASDLYKNGKIKLTGEKGVDYRIGSEGITLLKKDAELTYNFSGNAFAVQLPMRTDAGKAELKLSGASVNDTEEIDSYSIYSIDSVQAEKLTLAQGDYEVKITNTGEKNDASSGNEVEITGFFVGSESYEYPEKYPDGVTINMKEIKDDSKDDTVKEIDWSGYINDLNLINTIGLADDISNPSEEITRGKLASVLRKIIQPGTNDNQKWKDKAFAADNNDVFVGASEQGKTRFSDVETAHERYEDIMIVNDYRLMVGYGDGTFRPDSNVTLAEVRTVFLRLLGLNDELRNEFAKTGYAVSEQNILKTLEKIDKGANLNIGYLSRIINNVFDQPIYTLTFDGNVRSYEWKDTFAEYYFDLKSVTGQMTKTPITSLSGAVLDNSYLIGDTEIYGNDKVLYANDFIGRDVKAYYTNKDSELVFAFLTEKDTVEIINSKDLISFENNTFSYSSNKRRKTKKIESTDYVVFNGIGVQSFTDEQMNIIKGDITFVKAKNSGKNIVIVNSYEDWKVGKNDIDSKILYKEASNDGYEQFDYGKFDTLIVTNTLGEYISIESIKENDILSVAKNAYGARIICSQITEDAEILQKGDLNIEAGGIKEKTMNSKYYSAVFQNEEKSYNVLTLYSDVLSTVYAGEGNTYKLYFDTFGYVVYADVVYSTAKQAAVYKGVYVDMPNKDHSDEYCVIKCVDKTGKLVKMETQNKVKYTDRYGEVKIYKNAQELKDKIRTDTDAGEQLFLYTLNTQKQIKEIEMPRCVVGNTDPEDTIYNMAATGSIPANIQFAVHPYYKALIGDKARVYINSNTCHWYCPEGEDEKYYVAGQNLDNIYIEGQSNKSKADIYATKDSMLASYIIYKDKKNNSVNITDACRKVWFIKSVSRVLANDEIVSAVRAVSLNSTDNKEEVFYSKDGDVIDINGNETNYIDCCGDLLMDKGTTPNKTYSLKKGDIVCMWGDTGNYITGCYLVYRHDELYPNAPEGARTGWILGADQYKNSDDDYNGNPYAVSYGQVMKRSSITLTLWGTRVTRGFVVSYNDGIIKYTTQDLSLKDAVYDSSYFGDNLRKNVVYMKKVNFAANTVSELSDADILPYNKYKEDASQILYLGRGLDTGMMIVIEE